MQNNYAKEKAIITELVNKTLVDLHKHFPWTVVEIAISFNDRIGAENPFVVKVLDNVLDAESKAKLDEYLPECTDDGALPSDAALALMNSFTSSQVSQVLANQNLFSLGGGNQKEECLPWDLADAPLSYDNLGDEKIMAIKNIKMKMRELAMLRGIIAVNSEECDTECIAIDTMVEVLNFKLV